MALVVKRRTDLEERDIQRQTRHRSTVVLRRYIHNGGLFRANVSGRVGKVADPDRMPVPPAEGRGWG